MSHTLMLFERVLDDRLRQVVHIRRQQLGFMKGLGTVDGIFYFDRIWKSIEKSKKYYIWFLLTMRKHTIRSQSKKYEEA